MVLKGKVAIVTGAGGGVGRAIVKRLVSEGCKVALIGSNRDRLAKAAAEAGDDNKKNSTLAIAADITKEAEVLSAVEQTIS
ncbi:MAG TPA: SDR family NAD(P)-dependent oxidoreductase, partial [Nitrososphaera sp.]|nr:SDR family NAD(P)-dependent oxidoreductase [Nitrososphaera sp.]